MRKLKCLFGHNWVEGWITIKTYVPIYSERHVLVVYCTKCGKVARRCENENRIKRERNKKYNRKSGKFGKNLRTVKD